MIFEAGIAMLSQLASLHSWVSGISMGKAQKTMLNELSRMRTEVERLSDNILYVSSINQIADLSSSSSRTEELTQRQKLKNLLEPVHRSLHQDILSTAVAPTPGKMQSAFRRDPWEALFSIRPAARVKSPDNPDAIPILFLDNGSHYVGWQMRSILPTLFECSYEPGAGGLYKSGKLDPENTGSSTKNFRAPSFAKQGSVERTPPAAELQSDKTQDHPKTQTMSNLCPINLHCRIGREKGEYSEIVWDGEILNTGRSPSHCKIKVAFLDAERRLLDDYTFESGMLFEPGKPKEVSDFYWMTSAQAERVSRIVITPIRRSKRERQYKPSRTASS